MSRTSLHLLAAALTATVPACAGAAHSDSTSTSDQDVSAATRTSAPPSDDAAAPRDAGDVSDADPSTPSAHPECATRFGSGLAKSKWVSFDAHGKLAYATTPRGDRIADFSNAGYAGGGVAIPHAPVAKTLSPSGGDDTAAIQAAIDAVSHAPLTSGVRGAVLLAPGAFHVSKGLGIAASGVVLRGSGSGANGTQIVVSGPNHTFLSITGAGDRKIDGSTKTIFRDVYVPSGTHTFSVADSSRFHVGDDVVIERPITAPWIHFMGMDTLTRNGAPQTWMHAGSTKAFERVVTAIAGDAITVDAPLTDSFDPAYVSPPGATVAKYTYPGRIVNAGVEGLRVVAPLRTATAAYSLIGIADTIDAWVRDVAGENFTSGVSVGGGSKRVTIEDVHLSHDAATTYFTSAAPADFSINASQVLIARSSSTGGLKIWYLVTHIEQGPNAVVDFTATGQHSHLAPHQRWSTGLLVDSSNVTGGVAYEDAGNRGSGHGWTMGWGVVWNTHADVNVEQPPGAVNWAIGSIGRAPANPNAGYDSQGAEAAPKSLYLAQLCERLGPAALTSIGY
jgi:hypothetical protein